MTNPQVQELAEIHAKFRKDFYASMEPLDVILKRTIGEAHELGRTQGLEEAAKIADGYATNNHDFFMKFDGKEYNGLADKALLLSSECRKIVKDIRNLLELPVE